jgi:AhpD family alkylhydroperoxidase
MSRLEIFDPPMCCPTGVCGPSVDPTVARFAADVEWLADHGVKVARYSPTQQPAAFAGNPVVLQALNAGDEVLPLVLLDGCIVHQGSYPSRQQMAGWTGVEAVDPTLYTAAVEELVAIGAAIGSNCAPCFRSHFSRAIELGVSPDDIDRAVRTALAVKDVPARTMISLSQRFLQRSRGPGGMPDADDDDGAASEVGLDLSPGGSVVLRRNPGA